MTSSSVQNLADTVTFRTWVPYSVEACSSKRSKTYCSRPNDLTTRTPSAASSTCVASTPD